MANQDIISALLASEQCVVDWIAAMQPTTDAEKAQWATLLDLRDQIADDVDQILLRRVVAASKELSSQTGTLTTLTGQINATAKAMSNIASIISTATQIL